MRNADPDKQNKRRKGLEYKLFPVKNPNTLGRHSPMERNRKPTKQP